MIRPKMAKRGKLRVKPWGTVNLALDRVDLDRKPAGITWKQVILIGLDRIDKARARRKGARNGN